MTQREKMEQLLTVVLRCYGDKSGFWKPFLAGEKLDRDRVVDAMLASISHDEPMTPQPKTEAEKYREQFEKETGIKLMIELDPKYLGDKYPVWLESRLVQAEKEREELWEAVVYEVDRDIEGDEDGPARAIAPYYECALCLERGPERETIQHSKPCALASLTRKEQ